MRKSQFRKECRVDVFKVTDELNVSKSVAEELVLLGGNAETAIEASKASRGLDQAKARAIDLRFKRLEKKLS